MTSKTKSDATEPQGLPSPSLLVKIEKATLEGAGKPLGMPEKAVASRLVKVDAKQLERLRSLLCCPYQVAPG